MEEEIQGILENNIQSFLEYYDTDSEKEKEIISKFDNEDIRNIACNIISNEDIFDLIGIEILDYINEKK